MIHLSYSCRYSVKMATGWNKESAFRSSFSSKSNVTVLAKQTDESSDTQQLIESVFCSSGNESAGSRHGTPSLSSLSHHIDLELEQALLSNAELLESCSNSSGRLGPDHVTFNSSGSSGIVIVEADRLGVSSKSNFCTIRANTCVFAGKWMYEVMLSSKGIMQLGWCMADCQFSAEDGVGDTADSYAYDGSRVCRWNSKMHTKYGESWLAGDVIGVAIDCDNGVVTFMRNGHSLGDAFTDVKLGFQCAYFPAVSLSQSESVRANFGATPLRYPIPGYRTLQDQPTSAVIQSRVLGSYLEKLIPLMADCCLTKRKTTLYILAAQIMSRMASFLTNAYVTEDCIFRIMTKFCRNQKLISQLLDVFYALLQESELKSCMEHLTVCLLAHYQYSPVDAEFSYQIKYLQLLQCLVSHERIRKYLLQHIIFDKVKFPLFLHIKIPDDIILKELLPVVWWQVKVTHDDDDDAEDGDTVSEVDMSQDELHQKHQFLAACSNLRKKVAAMESMQTDILIMLLTCDDVTAQDSVSSRSIFANKFRIFLKEHMSPSHIRSEQFNQCPPFVLSCLFNRLMHAVRHYCSQDIFVPCHHFNDNTMKYWDMSRLGGLVSYLQKTYEAELSSQHNNSSHQLSDNAEHHYLVELLDGLVLLYNLAVHKQLGKMFAIKETFNEYISALSETHKKLARCPQELVTVRLELENAKQVFTEKMTEQSRQLAWVDVTATSQDKQEDVQWLMRCILRTVRNASVQAGPLFAFIPDLYIEACINCYNCLMSYFTPNLIKTKSADQSDLLNSYAHFVCTSFCDTRIISTDIRDTLVQALGLFVCYPESLAALEGVPLEDRLALCRLLLTPYENRPWAQTNWILVRLWKGCGFAYRYTNLPHVNKDKTQVKDIGTGGLRKPCPSLVFQSHIQSILNSDIDSATKLIDTMLNQLNWAFSEFVRMMQDLEELVVRPGALRDTVDGQKLKICATCFDISVGILRVIEMILSLSPELFLSTSVTHSELLLHRLLQMMTQVLNRVSGSGNTFDRIVNLRLPGLTSLDHFPILVAVAGILAQLIINSDEPVRQKVLDALVAEPGFQLNSIEFLLGGSMSASSSTNSSKPFDLSAYAEVSEAEAKQLQQLVVMLTSQVRQVIPQEVDEDLLCNICYAQIKSVMFLPCRHTSCRACITHQRMSRNECFFCKAKVDDIVDIVVSKISAGSSQQSA